MDGAPNPDGKDVYYIELNSALQHIKLAKNAEASDRYELGSKHYTEAANKLMGLLRSETDESKKKIFLKHLNDSISSAGFLKTIISDKKNALKSK